MAYTRQLDVLASSAGVIFNNVDRPDLKDFEIEDLLAQLERRETVPSLRTSESAPGAHEPERAFAAWMLAHFTATSENDKRRVANHRGFEASDASFCFSVCTMMRRPRFERR